MSLVCEAFGCVPSVARQEIADTNPNGYVWRILELRSYHQTKQAIDRAKRPDDEPTGPMAQLVNENTFRLVQEAHGRRQQDTDE